MTSPQAMASNPVVMPAAAIWASWASTAEAACQRTLGRGTTCRSRLSVCNSTRPGSR